MSLLSALLLAANVLAAGVNAKYVFAHVVVGNTAAHTVDTWVNDIVLAHQAGIDAFALNIAHGDTNTPTQVANAFAAAASADAGFKLFFSFDYLGGGSVWPPTIATETDGTFSVEYYLEAYKGSAYYFNYNSLPFVSTFEGPGNSADWAPSGSIRTAVGEVYFVPDWSSLGPSGITADLANIQGAFSWNMWPNGDANFDDSVDSSWQTALDAPATRSYMMGISPWFFHSASGSQEWVWRGDDLWSDRWTQALTIQPDFIEIVTWNDFAEAHYIGPIYTDSEIATGSAQYVDGYAHDSWRDFLPYYISQYKGTTFDITRDQMQYWYRTTPADGGSTCGVTGGIASQGDTEIAPDLVEQDAIFFSALLESAAQVIVQIGTNAAVTYQGVAGINHWSQAFDGQTGVPTFKISRSGVVASTFGTGAEITAATVLASGCVNYNAWVGSF